MYHEEDKEENAGAVNCNIFEYALGFESRLMIENHSSKNERFEVQIGYHILHDSVTLKI